MCFQRFAHARTPRVLHFGAFIITVVGFVCVSVNRDLTSGGFVGPEYDITYSKGNEGQNICVDFSETAPLQRYTASGIVWLSCGRPCCKPLMRMISG